MIVALGSTRDLQRLRATGRRVQCGPLTMIVSRESDPTTTRVAYAIGRQVGTAVRRNRVRRRLRAILRARETAGGMPGATYLVICRPPSVNLSSIELSSLVDQLLIDAGPAPQHQGLVTA